ncbi:MAG TPA: N-acetylmuramoyl-L-alanine amidase, partial [Polyangia bacterium]|nr:N-acetylmuramoyl-L-alanine amidase [Polyangia bacterium]
PLNEPRWRWWPGTQEVVRVLTHDRNNHGGDGRVHAIVIHGTAGRSSAGAMSVMLKDRAASWHWLIPDENEAPHGIHHWCTAPEYRAAWHVRGSCSHPAVHGGALSPNTWSLGIEVVNAQNRIDPFSRWQVERTAEIIRYARSKHPELRHVVSHAALDPERRTDPGPLFPWDKLRELVLAGGNGARPRRRVDRV